jgi:hypothetical protein
MPKHWTQFPQPLSTNKLSLVKEAWFYGGIAPSFHLVLINNQGQINIHLPQKFILKLRLCARYKHKNKKFKCQNKR